MKWLWPFRSGNDELFRQSPPCNDNGSIPERSYDDELERYLKRRWQRGWVHAITPSLCYGGAVGAAVGLRQARLEGKYFGRMNVVANGAFSGAALFSCTSFIHQILMMKNDYEAQLWMPMVAGTAAGTVFSGRLGGSPLGAMVFGTIYFLFSLAVTQLDKRRLVIFLAEQQYYDTPVHKVSPELQPMYQAYRYDYRPIEKQASHVRRTQYVTRAENDSRLDSQAVISTLSPEIYEWVNFPPWWPVKAVVMSAEEAMMEDRRHSEDKVRRQQRLLASGNMTRWNVTSVNEP